MFLAAAIAVSMAAPCNQTCTGYCDLLSQFNKLLPVNIPQVYQKISQTCVGGCSLACNCVDSTGLQCGAQLDTCRAGKTELLDNCGGELIMCLTKSFGECTVATAGGLFQQVFGYIQTEFMKYQGGSGN